MTEYYTIKDIIQLFSPIKVGEYVYMGIIRTDTGQIMNEDEILITEIEDGHYLGVLCRTYNFGKMEKRNDEVKIRIKHSFPSKFLSITIYSSKKSRL